MAGRYGLFEAGQKELKQSTCPEKRSQEESLFLRSTSRIQNTTKYQNCLLWWREEQLWQLWKNLICAKQYGC